MLIRCWGARGSIPVSGPEYLRYGGDTPCLEVRTADGDVVIVDAGSGIRKLGNRLLAEDRNDCTLIFTHAHWDHIMGFPFFKPIYRPQTRLTIYGCPLARHSVREMIAAVMNPPNFPVNFNDITAEITYHNECTDTFTIGSLKVTPIAISHPNQGMGYRFEENGRSFVFLTDNELTYSHPGSRSYEEYRSFSEGADLLIHDAEYLPEEYKLTQGWGHSVFTDACRLALDARAKGFALFHHNQERSDGELQEMVARCRKMAGGKMECLAMYQGLEIEI